MNISKKLKSVEFFNTFLDDTCVIMIKHEEEIYKNVSKEEFETGIPKPETLKKIKKHYDNVKTRPSVYAGLPSMRVFVSLLKEDLAYYESTGLMKQLKKSVDSSVALVALEFILSINKMNDADVVDYRLPDDLTDETVGLKTKLEELLNVKKKDETDKK